jgi:two-component system LytT family response regulator
MDIRTLIVEEEPITRNRIQGLLEQESKFHVTDSCVTGDEGGEAIRKQRPRLVFFGVRVAELAGLEVLRSLAIQDIPLIVFVTSYERAILEVLEANALDYLLKPFTDERFHQILHRATNLLQQPEEAEIQHRRILGLVGDLAVSPARLDRVAVKSAGRILFVNVDEIDWIEAADNYLRLHVGNNIHLVRGRMSELEKQLAPNQFVRIHRCTIVNLRRLKEFRPLRGQGTVLLLDGTQLEVSRSSVPKLRQFTNSLLWLDTAGPRVHAAA